ncbi:MAG TPA: ester cyclase [Candidatus Saccharimonadia bacterium]|jgi:steroid delta-isomerase-like uncharacterized protein|nr:ester cyclase [Candidatus Saccharimonadia bacterium]
MSQEEHNKAIARRFYEEIWNQANLAAVDELCEPDYVVVDLPPWRKPGAEGLKAFVADNRRMFPDVRTTIHHLMAEGDEVVVEFSATATHKGDLRGPVGLVPATNKPVTWKGITIFKIKNGKIVQSRGLVDNLSLMQQLGAVPQSQ